MSGGSYIPENGIFSNFIGLQGGHPGNLPQTRLSR
jgi:hypothetical protein